MCWCIFIGLYILFSLTSELFRYTQNGILHMLERNKRIKTRPERFQNCKDQFDLVITCEERVYDQVLEGEPHLNIISPVIFCLSLSVIYVSLSLSDLNSREQETFQPVHVINVDIQDNHEEATLGAFLICELCQCVSIKRSVCSWTLHRITQRCCDVGC